MGHLSPFRVDLLGLSIFLVIIATQTTAAPVQENSNSVSRFSNAKGCYYMNKLYPSGERIETNESCLNCTCAGDTLMCFLRICPFVKPLGEDCRQEQHVGDCCPTFWCPQTYPHATTEAPDSDARGCYLDGRYYDEGARIPMDPLKPCEVCYCIRNTSVCTMQQCELKVDGCFPQYKAGSCCPSRYNCTEEAATTIPPGVMEPEEYEGCKVDGVMYKDGEVVPSKDNCENCYCMKHEVVCAVQECQAPADNCIPEQVEEGQCCPTKYECPPTSEVPVWLTTLPPPLHNATDLPPPVSDHLTTLSGVLDDRIRQTFTEQESESFPTKVFADGKPELFTTESALDVVTPIRLATTEVTVDNGTLPAGDLVSRPREPKITEVPDDMFTSAALPKATGRPVFFPSRPIPGEGICRHENKTYQNKQSIPSADPCRLNCTCLNSVVLCEQVECVLSPPESGSNCKLNKLPDECCPKYVCDTTRDEPVETIVPSDVTEEQQLVPAQLSTITPIETSEASIAVSTQQVQKEITIESESLSTVSKEPTTEQSDSKVTERTKETEEESETTLASVTSTQMFSSTTKKDEEIAEDVEASTLELSLSHETTSVTPEFTSSVTESTSKALSTEEDEAISGAISTTRKDEEVTSTTALPTIPTESDITSLDEVSSVESVTEEESSVTGIHARTKSTTPEPPTEAEESTATLETKPSSGVDDVKQETEGKPTHFVTEATPEETEISTHSETEGTTPGVEDMKQETEGKTTHFVTEATPEETEISTHSETEGTTPGVEDMKQETEGKPTHFVTEATPEEAEISTHSETEGTTPGVEDMKLETEGKPTHFVTEATPEEAEISTHSETEGTTPGVKDMKQETEGKPTHFVTEATPEEAEISTHSETEGTTPGVEDMKQETEGKPTHFVTEATPEEAEISTHSETEGTTPGVEDMKQETEGKPAHFVTEATPEEAEISTHSETEGTTPGVEDMKQETEGKPTHFVTEATPEEAEISTHSETEGTTPGVKDMKQETEGKPTHFVTEATPEEAEISTHSETEGTTPGVEDMKQETEGKPTHFVTEATPEEAEISTHLENEGEKTSILPTLASMTTKQPEDEEKVTTKEAITESSIEAETTKSHITDLDVLSTKEESFTTKTKEETTVKPLSVDITGAFDTTTLSVKTAFTEGSTVFNTLESETTTSSAKDVTVEAHEFTTPSTSSTSLEDETKVSEKEPAVKETSMEVSSIHDEVIATSTPLASETTRSHVTIESQPITSLKESTTEAKTKSTTTPGLMETTESESVKDSLVTKEIHDIFTSKDISSTSEEVTTGETFIIETTKAAEVTQSHMFEIHDLTSDKEEPITEVKAESTTLKPMTTEGITVSGDVHEPTKVFETIAPKESTTEGRIEDKTTLAGETTKLDTTVVTHDASILRTTAKPIAETSLAVETEQDLETDKIFTTTSKDIISPQESTMTSSVELKTTMSEETTVSHETTEVHEMTSSKEELITELKLETTPNPVMKQDTTFETSEDVLVTKAHDVTTSGEVTTIKSTSEVETTMTPISTETHHTPSVKEFTTESKFESTTTKPTSVESTSSSEADKEEEVTKFTSSIASEKVTTSFEESTVEVDTTTAEGTTESHIMTEIHDATSLKSTTEGILERVTTEHAPTVTTVVQKDSFMTTEKLDTTTSKHETTEIKEITAESSQEAETTDSHITTESESLDVTELIESTTEVKHEMTTPSPVKTEPTATETARDRLVTKEAVTSAESTTVTPLGIDTTMAEKTTKSPTTVTHETTKESITDFKVESSTFKPTIVTESTASETAGDSVVTTEISDTTPEKEISTISHKEISTMKPFAVETTLFVETTKEHKTTHDLSEDEVSTTESDRDITVKPHGAKTTLLAETSFESTSTQRQEEAMQTSKVTTAEPSLTSGLVSELSEKLDTFTTDKPPATEPTMPEISESVDSLTTLPHGGTSTIFESSSELEETKTFADFITTKLPFITTFADIASAVATLTTLSSDFGKTSETLPEIDSTGVDEKLAISSVAEPEDASSQETESTTEMEGESTSQPITQDHEVVTTERTTLTSDQHKFTILPQVLETKTQASTVEPSDEERDKTDTETPELSTLEKTSTELPLKLTTLSEIKTTLTDAPTKPPGTTVSGFIKAKTPGDSDVTESSEPTTLTLVTKVQTAESTIEKAKEDEKSTHTEETSTTHGIQTTLSEITESAKTTQKETTIAATKPDETITKDKDSDSEITETKDLTSTGTVKTTEGIQHKTTEPVTESSLKTTLQELDVETSTHLTISSALTSSKPTIAHDVSGGLTESTGTYITEVSEAEEISTRKPSDQVTEVTTSKPVTISESSDVTQLTTRKTPESDIEVTTHGPEESKTSDTTITPIESHKVEKLSTVSELESKMTTFVLDEESVASSETSATETSRAVPTTEATVSTERAAPDIITFKPFDDVSAGETTTGAVSKGTTPIESTTITDTFVTSSKTESDISPKTATSVADFTITAETQEAEELTTTSETVSKVTTLGLEEESVALSETETSEASKAGPTTDATVSTEKEIPDIITFKPFDNISAEYSTTKAESKGTTPVEASTTTEALVTTSKIESDVAPQTATSMADTEFTTIELFTKHDVRDTTKVLDQTSTPSHELKITTGLHDETKVTSSEQSTTAEMEEVTETTVPHTTIEAHLPTETKVTKEKTEAEEQDVKSSIKPVFEFSSTAATKLSDETTVGGIDDSKTTVFSGIMAKSPSSESDEIYTTGVTDLETSELDTEEQEQTSSSELKTTVAKEKTGVTESSTTHPATISSTSVSDTTELKITTLSDLPTTRKSTADSEIKETATTEFMVSETADSGKMTTPIISISSTTEAPTQKDETADLGIKVSTEAALTEITTSLQTSSATPEVSEKIEVRTSEATKGEMEEVRTTEATKGDPLITELSLEVSTSEPELKTTFISTTEKHMDVVTEQETLSSSVDITDQTITEKSTETPEADTTAHTILKLETTHGFTDEPKLPEAITTVHATTMKSTTELDSKETSETIKEHEMTVSTIAEDEKEVLTTKYVTTLPPTDMVTKSEFSITEKEREQSETTGVTTVASTVTTSKLHVSEVTQEEGEKSVATQRATTEGIVTKLMDTETERITTIGSIEISPQSTVSEMAEEQEIEATDKTITEEAVDITSKLVTTQATTQKISTEGHVTTIEAADELKTMKPEITSTELERSSTELPMTTYVSTESPEKFTSEFPEKKASPTTHSPATESDEAKISTVVSTSDEGTTTSVSSTEFMIAERETTLKPTTVSDKSTTHAPPVFSENISTPEQISETETTHTISTPLSTEEAEKETAKPIVTDLETHMTTDHSKLTTASVKSEIPLTTSTTKFMVEEETETTSTILKTSPESTTTKSEDEAEKTTLGVPISSSTVASESTSVSVSEKFAEDEDSKIISTVTEIPELKTTSESDISVTEFSFTKHTLAEETTMLTTEEEMEETRVVTEHKATTVSKHTTEEPIKSTSEREIEAAATVTPASTTEQSYPTSYKTTHMTKDIDTRLEMSTPESDEKISSEETIAPPTKERELTSPTVTSHGFTTEFTKPTTPKVEGLVTHTVEGETATAKPVEISLTEAETPIPQDEKISSLLPKTAVTEVEKFPEILSTTEEPETTEPEVTVVSEEVLLSNHTFGVDSMVKEHSTTLATTTERKEVFDTTLVESITLKPFASTDFVTELAEKETKEVERLTTPKAETTQSVLKDTTVLPKSTTILPLHDLTEKTEVSDEKIVTLSSEAPFSAETEAVQKITTGAESTPESHEAFTSDSETTLGVISTRKEEFETSSVGSTIESHFTELEQTTKEKVPEETKLLFTADSEVTTPSLTTTEKIQTELPEVTTEISQKSEERTTIHALTTETAESKLPSDATTIRTTSQETVKTTTLLGKSTTSVQPEATEEDTIFTPSSTYVSETVGSDSTETILGKTVEKQTTKTELVAEQDKTTPTTENPIVKITTTSSAGLPEHDTTAKEQLETIKEQETTPSDEVTREEKFSTSDISTSAPIEAETSTSSEFSSVKPETTEIHETTVSPTDTSFKPHTTVGVTIKSTESVQEIASPSEKDDALGVTITESSEGEETTAPIGTSVDELVPKSTSPHASTESTMGEVTTGAVGTVVTKSEDTTTGGMKDSIITSEPVSPVTESTSSTATTISVSVTEMVTRAFSEAHSTGVQETEETTIVPLSVTTPPADEEPENTCKINGTVYDDGDPIEISDPCEKCHCVEGTVSCFKIICKVSKQGCFPDEHKVDECCPSSYKCPSNKNETEFVSTLKQEVTQKDLTTPIPISFMFSTLPTSISSTILITKAPSDELSTLKVDLGITEKAIVTSEKTLEGITELEGQSEVETTTHTSSTELSDVSRQSTLEPKERVTELEHSTTVLSTISIQGTGESSEISTVGEEKLSSTEKAEDLDRETTERSFTTLGHDDKTALLESEKEKTLDTFGITTPTGGIQDETLKSTTPVLDEGLATTESDVQRHVEEHVPVPEDTTSAESDVQRNVEEHVPGTQMTSATESDVQREVEEPQANVTSGKPISETEEESEETSKPTTDATEVETVKTAKPTSVATEEESEETSKPTTDVTEKETSETVTHREEEMPITEKEMLSTFSAGLTHEDVTTTTAFADVKTTKIMVHPTTEAHQTTSSSLHDVIKLTTEPDTGSELLTATESDIESRSSIDQKETTLSRETTSIRFTDSTEKSGETESDHTFTTIMPVKLPKLDDTFTTTAQTTEKEMTTEKPGDGQTQTEAQEMEITSTAFSELIPKISEMDDHFTTPTVSSTGKSSTEKESGSGDLTTLTKDVTRAEVTSKITTASEVVTTTSQETTTYSPSLSTRSQAVTTADEEKKTSTTLFSSDKPIEEKTMFTTTSDLTGAVNLFEEESVTERGDKELTVTETSRQPSSTLMSTVSVKLDEITSSDSVTTEKPTEKSLTTVVYETETEKESEIVTTRETAASKTGEDVLELKTSPALVTFSETTTHQETETPELVTETVETKVTFVSLSKEGTTGSPAKTTGLDSETEGTELASDAGTPEVKLPTTEQTLTVATTKSDEARTTDKIFQFVSSRFTTIPTTTISSEISKEISTVPTKSVTEEEMKTTPNLITQEGSQKDTEHAESAEITRQLTLTSTVSKDSLEEVITTKRPSIKSLDGVETSETPLFDRTTSSQTLEEKTELSVTSSASVSTERATEEGVAISVKEATVTEETSTTTTGKEMEATKEESSESTVSKLITTTSPTVKFTTIGSATDEVTEISTLTPKSAPSTEAPTTETIAEDSKSTTSTTTHTTKGIRDDVKFTERTTTEAQDIETVTTESDIVSTGVQDVAKTDEDALLSVTITPATTKSDLTFVTELDTKTFITSTEKVMEVFTENATSSDEQEVEQTSTLSSLVTAFKERIRTTVSPLFYFSTEKALTDSTEQSILTEKPSFGEGFTVMTDREEGVKTTEVTFVEKDENVTELPSTSQETEVSTPVSEISQPSTTLSPIFKTSDLFTTSEPEDDKSKSTELVTEERQPTTPSPIFKTSDLFTPSEPKDDKSKSTELVTEERQPTTTLSPIFKTSDLFTTSEPEDDKSKSTELVTEERQSTTQSPIFKTSDLFTTSEPEDDKSKSTELVTEERQPTTPSPIFKTSDLFTTSEPKDDKSKSTELVTEERQPTTTLSPIFKTSDLFTTSEPEDDKSKSTELVTEERQSTTQSPIFKTSDLFTTSESEDDKSKSTKLVTEERQPTTLTSLEMLTKDLTEKTTKAETHVTTEETPKVIELTTEKKPDLSTLGATEGVFDDEILSKSTLMEKETTVISEAETTTAGETRQPTATEITTPKPTEVVTKAFKAIETTPMPTQPPEAENTTALDDEDYQLDEGSCIFEGRIYQSAEQIPREDACEFCFCFRGDIICLQQSCPPPAPNCHRTMIPGYCCPRYDCPVLVTSRNISSLSRRKGVQPIIIQKRIEKRAVRAAVEVKGCQINGTFYQVGQTVAKSSGPCLHCLCEDGGNMRCDPQKCKPEAPLMLKMNNSYFRRR